MCVYSTYGILFIRVSVSLSMMNNKNFFSAHTSAVAIDRNNFFFTLFMYRLANGSRQNHYLIN